MARKKTTQAEIRSARFNPATSPEDADALDIIKRLEDEGYNFKQIAQDAILRADGRTPEMYSRSTPIQASLISRLEDMLTEFAEEIVQKIEDTGIQVRPTDEESGSREKPSPFARNFANGFIQRQQQVLGDEED